MKTIGLTGGSGAGKGCVCHSFLKLDINSIDTDKVYRELCLPGSPCLIELIGVFGNGILNEDGTLDRKELASIVFSDKEKLEVLNLITHRYILNSVREWLEIQRSEGRLAAIVDAPLLYESGFDKECDIVIAVVSDKATRIKRIIARDSISEQAAEKRLSNQGDDSFYTQNADFVIINNGSKDELDAQTKEIYTKLFGNIN